MKARPRRRRGVADRVSAERGVAAAVFVSVGFLVADVHARVGVSAVGLVMVGLLLAKVLVADRYRRRTYFPPLRHRLRVAAIVPLHNEDPEYAVAAVRSLLSQSRLPERIHVVDDGSFDDGAAASAVRRLLETSGHGVEWDVTIYPHNRGKRYALGLGFRADRAADVFLCIDSDTVLEPDAIEQGLRPFADPGVAAVAGAVTALNWNRNILTRLIDLRYISAFLGERAAYAAFGAVLCCCGSLSFYRGSVARRNLNDFLNQRFLGQPAHAGDDRRLTNYALRQGRVVFAERSRAATAVPERMSHYLRQQLRWNKSFFRESMWVLATFPLSHAAFWLTLLEMLTWGWLGSVLVYGGVIRPLVGDPRDLLLLAAFIPLAAWLRSTSYLEYRGGISFRQRLAVFALAPLYGLLHLFVLTPLRICALLTLKQSAWGTRAQVEVRLASVARSDVRAEFEVTPRPGSLRRAGTLALCLAGVMCAGSDALAQQAPATVRVVVLDESGATVAGARVAVSTAAQVWTAVSGPRGEARFDSVPSGQAHLVVERAGFAIVERTIVPGEEPVVRVVLSLSAFTDEVAVVARWWLTRETEIPSLLLDANDIANLASDTASFRRELETMAGGVEPVFRVDGFATTRIPARVDTDRVRIRSGPFAPEVHEWGQSRVEIATKPPLTAWSGAVNAGLRAQVLAARSPFALTPPPGQSRRFTSSLRGPLLRGRTGLRVTGDGGRAYDAGTVVARTLEGSVVEQVQRAVDQHSVSVGIDQALGAHFLRMEFRSTGDTRGNLGVGNFDLAERAYRRETFEQRLQTSADATLGGGWMSRFRTAWSSRRTQTRSQTDAPTVVVIDAFGGGGAGLSSDGRASALHVAEDLGFERGAHAVRAGFTLDTTVVDETDARNTLGTFVFRSLSDFAAGTPSTFTRRTAPSVVGFTHTEVGLYWQDDFRLGDALSLNAGLRYEAQSAAAGSGRLMPRLSVAWRPPAGAARLTMRGSFGRFSDWFSATTRAQALRDDGVRSVNLLILNPAYPDPTSAAPTVLTGGRTEIATALTMPLVDQRSFGIDVQVARALSASVMYLGAASRHQLRTINRNAPIDGVRPEPTLGTIALLASTGRLSMHRLQTSVTYRPARRSTVLTGTYTLGRFWNHTDNPFTFPADSAAPDAEWGPSVLDVRHRFSVVASLPLWWGLRGSFTGNGQSGMPYTIVTGGDDNRDGINNDRPAGMSRNAARTSSRVEFGARVARTIATVAWPGSRQPKPRLVLELYAQGTNILNRRNFINFSGNMASPFFGQPTSAALPRRIEVGLQTRF